LGNGKIYRGNQEKGALAPKERISRSSKEKGESKAQICHETTTAGALLHAGGGKKEVGANGKKGLVNDVGGVSRSLRGGQYQEPPPESSGKIRGKNPMQAAGSSDITWDWGLNSGRANLFGKHDGFPPYQTLLPNKEKQPPHDKTKPPPTKEV